jgi:hypothetical protein
MSSPAIRLSVSWVKRGTTGRFHHFVCEAPNPVWFHNILARLQSEEQSEERAKPCTTPDHHFRSGSLGVPKIEEWANLTDVSVALKGKRGGRHGY